MEGVEKLTLNDKVLLSDGDVCKLVELRDVRFFETCGNYTQTYFENGKLLIYRTLSYLDSRLSEKYFFRANRQQIVNLSHIKNIQLMDNSYFRIEMTCGKKIELSRRRSRLFKGAMSL
jgi:two-component system, LytTR family, response regulator